MQQGQSTLQQIEIILPQLPPPQLELVLAVAEFLRGRAAQADEDEMLWSFVEREQRYRATYPEDVVVLATEEELLAALDAES